ncbi:MAG: pilus assembly protein PilM [Lentisphaeria bacterium]|nr:pilus assembly protein PilM [Lentisphaeria bacterium]NQZ69951.1 pilus assembly protein PilM [Lentisphaeria bacterium]
MYSQIAGLDIGQTNTKLVIVEKKGKNYVIKKALSFTNSDEGIIDETELLEHLGSWLRENKLMKEELCIGIQQYMPMIQVSDFPQCSGAKLQEMVTYETHQLAGLSNDAFVEDFKSLKPDENSVNPVMIVVCREDAIDIRIDPLENSGGNIADICMDGEALESTFLTVNKTSDTGVTLLIDIGTDNSTLTIMKDNQAIHFASFLYGSALFSESIAKHEGISSREADKLKLEGTVTDNPDNPLTVAAGKFISELEISLDNWRSHSEHTAALEIHEIFLTGGGSKLDGLDDYLSTHYAVNTSPLSVPALDNLESHGSYHIAYGLAITALKKNENKLSLLPQDRKWDALRRVRIPLLYASLIFLILNISAFMFVYKESLSKERKNLAMNKRRLAECEELLPKLKEERSKVENLDHMLKPFAAKGNRNRIFRDSLILISKTKNKPDWMVFMADTKSYHNIEDSSGPIKKWGKRNSKSNIIDTSTVEPWTELYCSGFTPKNNAQPWKSVAEMMKKLDESDLFKSVVLNAHRSKMDIAAGEDWSFFKMRPFALRLPLEAVEFKVKAK